LGGWLDGGYRTADINDWRLVGGICGWFNGRATEPGAVINNFLTQLTAFRNVDLTICNFQLNVKRKYAKNCLYFPSGLNPGGIVWV